MPRIISYPSTALSPLQLITISIINPSIQNLTSLSMATSFSCFTPNPISSGRRGTSIAASNSWWTPILGWSSDPDYIQTNPTDRSGKEEQESADSNSGSKSRFQLGCFTEEKAKQLRMKTMETATFHDIMYHSAIASRLASDVSRRSNT